MTGQNISPHATPPLNVMAPPFRPTHMDVALLAQAIQDSIAVNRLPTLEPAVFDGNLISFEWKEMFVCHR